MNATTFSRSAVARIYDKASFAGMMTTAQLGNEGDTSWAPTAPCLLLSPIANFSSAVQWHAVVKRDNGDLIILLDASEAVPEHCFDDTSDARFYCTSAVNFTNGDYERRLRPELAKHIKAAMDWHHSAVETLEMHSRIFRN